jgi:hypothetical protein
MAALQTTDILEINGVLTSLASEQAHVGNLGWLRTKAKTAPT